MAASGSHREAFYPIELLASPSLENALRVASYVWPLVLLPLEYRSRHQWARRALWYAEPALLCASFAALLAFLLGYELRSGWFVAMAALAVHSLAWVSEAMSAVSGRLTAE